MANDNEDKLVIEIELDDGKLAKGFINAKSIAASEGQKAGKSFGDGAVGAASAGLGKLGVVIAALAAAVTGAFAVGKLVSAAQENEEAVNRLNGSLRLNGEFTTKTSEALQEYASQLSRTSTISSEAIMEQLALANSMGATAAQSKKIVATAADMSAALGISFQSAVSNLTRTLNGTSGTLGKLSSDIKGLTEDQLKAGVAIDIFSGKFAGFAGTKTLGFSGALAGMKNALGNLVTEMGKLITKSPVIIATFNVMAKYLDIATKSVAGMANNKDGINSISFAVVKLGQALNTYLIAPLEFIYNIGKIAFNGLLTGIATISRGLDFILGKMAEAAEALGIKNSFTAALKQMDLDSAEILDQMVVRTQDSFDKIFDFSFADKTSQIVDEIGEATAIVANKVNDSVADASGKSTVVVQKLSKDIKQLQTMLHNGLTRVVSSSMETLGASLVNGGKAFDHFGATIIGITGDLATQLGAAYIAIGIGIEAIGKSALALTGGPAIAAGLALLILGGALKAFASQHSGTAASNSVVPQTGGDSFGGQPIDNTTITQPETQREREPTVNVVIQGDVFDSAETGRRIVDILNDSMGKEGLKIKRGAFA